MNQFPSNNQRGMTPSEASNADEPQVLLPTKVYHQTQGGGYQAYPNSPVRWTAQPVLQWLETLASAAEDAEVSQDQEHYDPASHRPRPITIDGVKLSESSPPPPVIKGWNMAQPKPPSELWPSEKQQHFDKHGISQDDWVQTPKHWNSYFLEERDPLAWMYTRQMDRLAAQVEALPGADLATYQMVQTRLEFTFGRILEQFPYGTSPECGEMRSLLNTLYNDTIQKLEELAEKTTQNQQPTKMDSFGGITAVAATTTTTVGAALNKKDLQRYMTSWLRDNWTNPYPDDDGLAVMARDCGTSTTQVSNWLINARTRKWRPAIVKATQMNRPSSLLLEDSINIFDGKPIRDIDIQHQQHQQQQQHIQEDGGMYSGVSHHRSNNNSNKRVKFDHY